MRNILRKLTYVLIDATLNKYALVLIPALLLSALGFHFMSQLTLQSSLTSLLPDHYRSVRTLNEIQDKVGGFQTLQVLVEGENFEDLKNYSKELAEAYQEYELVKAIDYQKDVEFFEKNALLYLSSDELDDIYTRLDNKVKGIKKEVNPFFIDLEDEEETTEEEEDKLSFSDYREKYEATDERRYYINPEKTIMVINIYPKGSHANVAYARKFFDHIKAITRAVQTPDGITISYGGNFKNKIDEYEVVISDAKSSVLIGLAAVFLLLLVHFRHLMAAVIIAVSLFMSLTWTFGITKLFIGELNTMTVFLFIILFGLGIDYGIHLMARYIEERRSGDQPRKAMETTIRRTGRALRTTAITSSAAFFTLMLADFNGFYEFGFIAGTGVMLAYLANLVLTPSLTMFCESLGLFRVSQKMTERQFHVPKSWLTTSRIFVVVGLVFMLFSIFMSSKVEFEYDFTNLRSNLPSSVEVKKKLRTIFKESNSPALVLADTKEELNAIEEALIERDEKDETPTFDKFKSIYNALPADQDEKLPKIAKIKDLLSDNFFDNLEGSEKEDVDKLRDLTDVSKLDPEDLPESIKRLFRGLNIGMGQFGYVFTHVELKDGRNAILFAEDVKNIPTALGKTFHPSNSSVVFADMLVMMLREGKRAILLTFFAIFLFVYFDVRSFRRTFLVLTPLIMGVFWLLGVMFLFNIKLNFFNILVIPTILGIGIDNGVHIFHRYRQEGRGSLRKVLKNSGAAISISSVTTMVGFLGMVFAYHPGLNSLGSLAVLGILMSLIAALAVLPGLLKFLETQPKLFAWFWNSGSKD